MAAAAEAVLGQPNFTSGTPHTTQSGMNEPWGVFVDAGGRLWVGDEYNNRVLRFDNASNIATGANANGVLGQPDFIHNNALTTQSGMYFPVGVFVDASRRLWVGDWGNDRVLRFDYAGSRVNGANADGVLGQPNFTTWGSAITQNGMDRPYNVVVDASGRLWEGDWGNNRVLRFDNAAAKPNGANADGVLGQPNFTSNSTATTQRGMYFPSVVAVDNSSGRLYVADTFNNRILAYDSRPG